MTGNREQSKAVLLTIPRSLFPIPFFALCLWGVLLFFPGCRLQPRIRVVVQQTTPLLDIAAREIAARLKQGGYRVEVSTGPQASAGLTNAVILSVDAAGSSSKPESFRIAPIRTSGFLLLRVTGADLRGAFWGALEAADQLVSVDRLEAVRATTANPFFPIRAGRLPLPLLRGPVSPEARREAGDQWRQYFDFLLRNRFNSVFFEASEPLSRYAHIGGEAPEASSSPSFPADDRPANIEWLHDIFRMARDRGLDPYLALQRSALAPGPSRSDNPSRAREQADIPYMERGSGSAQTTLAAFPPAGGVGLPQALPAALETYPELAGVALAEDVMAMSGPAERRGAWIAENFLVPLAQKKERRPVFLGVNGDWWPLPGAFGGVESSIPVYLWAPLQKLDESPPNSAYPVLWQADMDTEELRPWQDPNTVQAAIRRMSARNSLGFVEASYQDSPRQMRQQAESGNPDRPPGAGQDWFRAMLWGRLGYSPEVPGSYWQQQFESHFGNQAGPFVYAATAHGNQVLALLQSSSGTSGFAPAGEPEGLEQFLFQPISGNSHGDFVTDALYQRGLMLAQKQDKSGGSSPSLAEALEREARQSLSAARRASRDEAWTGADNLEFYRRILRASTKGLAYAGYLRAAQALARFVAGGGEDSRLRAIQLLQQAQEALSAAEAGSAKEGAPEAGPSLSFSIGRAIEFSRQLQPWPWDRTNWELGTLPGWQPASPADVPIPSEWRRAETSRLSEFGFYGRQPRMSSINQQLAAAFLPAETERKPGPGSLLVGKTIVPAKREGRLVLRVVSSDPAMVWVRRRRAGRLSEQQFPWIAASAPPAPFQSQLLSAPVQAGDNEVIVAANAGENWPLVSLNFLLPPETRDIAAIPPRQAARLEGGVVLTAASGAFPQPYISLAEAETQEASGPAPTGAVPLALYRFQIRDPGFYRLRFWCYWRTVESPNLTLTLDGAVLKKGLGLGERVYQKWHWVPLEAAVDLGPGEHSLAIQGWRRGALLGTIEIFPAW